jgi:peptidyl-prolyl cis-trans isomerase B (cyclophilin B)
MEASDTGGGVDRRWIILAVFALVAVAVVAAILIGRSSGDDGSTTAGAEGCKQVPEPKPKQVGFEKPKQTVKRGEEVSARIETSCGDFTIALDSERAPKTVNSFVFLSEEGFYDGLTFPRIEPGFMIQAGDPLGEGTVGGDGGGIGTGGPGYRVTEKPSPTIRYPKGAVGMLQRSPPLEPPGRSGSQFFVISSNAASSYPRLAAIYAPLGRVSDGFDVIERIDALGNSASEPKRTVLIESITIERD